MLRMWQTLCDICGNRDVAYVTSVTNALLHMWQIWCYIFDIHDICDKRDLTYVTYMTYVTYVMYIHGNSDVIDATNAMWVLWQMRSDICDIFDKCDICDKRNVTYMAYVDFRGWTLQENSLNWLEIFYLKCSFKWKQLLLKTTIIRFLSCVWLTAYANWINNESVKSSPFSFNEYVWYDKLWGPSLRVVTLFSILKYSYIPTSLYYPYI